VSRARGRLAFIASALSGASTPTHEQVDVYSLICQCNELAKLQHDFYDFLLSIYSRKSLRLSHLEFASWQKKAKHCLGARVPGRESYLHSTRRSAGSS
jgi:hypothetical protein